MSATAAATLQTPATEPPIEARAASLRHIVSHAYADRLLDRTAHTTILDALAHPDQTQARRMALHELVRWNAQWASTDLGAEQVQLLCLHLAPQCTAETWQGLCEEYAAVDEYAPKTGRDWHHAERARRNVNVLLDIAVGLRGVAR